VRACGDCKLLNYWLFERLLPLIPIGPYETIELDRGFLTFAMVNIPGQYPNS
jgi:hypothetical protein